MLLKIFFTYFSLFQFYFVIQIHLSIFKFILDYYSTQNLLSNILTHTIPNITKYPK